jgi:hypothetical protein
MNQSDAPGSKAGDLVSLGDEKKVLEVVAASVLSLSVSFIWLNQTNRACPRRIGHRCSAVSKKYSHSLLHAQHSSKL